MFAQITPEQTQILGKGFVLATSVLAAGVVAVASYYMLLTKATYSIIHQHEGPIPSLMLAAKSWPMESRAFRAETMEATASKIVRRLETLREGNATIISTLDAISVSLTELHYSPSRLEQIKEDVGQVEHYVSRLPHLLASVSRTLEHLTPTPRRFHKGINAIKDEYQSAIADGNTTISQKVRSYAAIWVLDSYTFDQAAAYMGQYTTPARKMFTEREGEYTLLQDLLAETTLRLERAKA